MDSVATWLYWRFGSWPEWWCFSQRNKWRLWLMQRRWVRREYRAYHTWILCVIEIHWRNARILGFKCMAISHFRNLTCQPFLLSSSSHLTCSQQIIIGLLRRNHQRSSLHLGWWLEARLTRAWGFRLSSSLFLHWLIYGIEIKINLAHNCYNK